MQHGSRQLTEWIDRMGITQREAAEKLGFDHTTLNKILKGKRRPSLHNAIEIRDVTGIAVDAWEPTRVADRRLKARQRVQKPQDWRAANA